MRTERRAFKRLNTRGRRREARRWLADRRAGRTAKVILSEDPDYGDLGQAFPFWTGRSTGAILQPPKPQIIPSAEILQVAAEHDIEPEAGN